MPINKGVMGLPKLALYRYAFCLRHVAQWTLLPEKAPPWFEIERRLFSPLAPIHALSSNIPSELKSHPIISNLCIVWKKFSKAFNINVYLNSESCIWNNPSYVLTNIPFYGKGRKGNYYTSKPI